MARIDFRELTKTFPGGTSAVDDLDLEITDGEFMVVVGPSGSGKTTVLRIAAGLEQATSGEVWIGDEVMNDVPPMDRNIAMVFQSYALYPHMTVYENMAFGLKLHGLKKREIEPRVNADRADARHRRAAQAEAVPALGRTAAAGRHGPGDRARARRVPDGRAALQPRREAARRDARVPGNAPPAAPDDHALRHARPDRGDDDGRPRRGHARRPAAAGGPPAAPLRPPRQPLRRRLHRLAGDEPRPLGADGAGRADPRGLWHREPGASATACSRRGPHCAGTWASR